jgi:hypothetical protein
MRVPWKKKRLYFFIVYFFISHLKMLIDKNMPPSFSIMIVHCGDDLGAVGNTNSTRKRTSQLKGIFFTFANNMP